LQRYVDLCLELWQLHKASRRWPPALKEAGAWPLTSLRQSFLNGTLTRLIEPDSVLRRKIIEFVEHGDFGLASGTKTPQSTSDL